MLLFLLFLASTAAFAPSSPSTRPKTSRQEMKRPFLDQLATTVFKMEQSRVDASSVEDEQGRVGEPMEWSEKDSLANRFSQIMAGPGYAFKQAVADLVAGDYDKEATHTLVQDHISSSKVAMFSFSTCPFCRRAKDYLDEQGIAYTAMELDEVEEGNAIRATLGTLTRRTSVPAIFVKGEFIGGCNDGPGLLTLAENGELEKMLA